MLSRFSSCAEHSTENDWMTDISNVRKPDWMLQAFKGGEEKKETYWIKGKDGRMEWQQRGISKGRKRKKMFWTETQQHNACRCSSGGEEDYYEKEDEVRKT